MARIMQSLKLSNDSMCVFVSLLCALYLALTCLACIIYCPSITVNACRLEALQDMVSCIIHKILAKRSLLGCKAFDQAILFTQRGFQDQRKQKVTPDQLLLLSMFEVLKDALWSKACPSANMLTTSTNPSSPCTYARMQIAHLHIYAHMHICRLHIYAQ